MHIYAKKIVFLRLKTKKHIHMLLNISILEWLGYLSSVIVAISLTMSSIIKLRWFNLIGAAAFSFYGFMIGSLPVGFLNFFIVCINIFYLIKIYSQKEAFHILNVKYSDNYLNYFLDFNKDEIKQFFPGFTRINLSDNSDNILIFKLLRDCVVAGVFIGIKNENTLTVVLDYVSAPYRDLKPGSFLYKQNKIMFNENGIDKIKIITDNKQHINYLKSMNFKSEQNNTYYLSLE